MRRECFILVMVALAAVIGLGLYLRLASINSVPFNMDEYATALQTTGIMETWKPTLPSGWVQWSEPVVLPYLMSFVWRLTGPDIMVGRLFCVAVGTLSVLVAYLLGRRLHNQTLGLIFAFLIGTNLWSITSSTFFRSYALAELGFLSICYLTVVWLQGRSFRSYLLVLSASATIAVISHYLLALVIPVVALLPLIAKLTDTIGKRIQLQPLEQSEATGQEGTRFTVIFDTRMILVLLSLALALGLGTWVLFQYGVLLAKAIGNMTGEFFTILPENARITFKPFFVQSLQRFYGPGTLALIVGGALVMLAQTGRRGLTILLYFVFPFVLFSTIFTSLTRWGMMDRYIFPYNPPLLLMVAFLLVWVGDNLIPLLKRMAQRVFGKAEPVMAGAISVLLVLGLVIANDAFVLKFSQSTTPTSVEAWVGPRSEPRIASFHRTALYIKEHMAASDVVLTTRPYGLPFELPDTRGYWLMPNPKEVTEATIMTERGLVYRYTGSPVITNLGQLLVLMAENNSGWLVLLYFHDSPGVLTPAIWSFVHTQMASVPDASDTTIQVFRWKAGDLNFVPVKKVPEGYGNTYQVLSLTDDVTVSKGQPGAVNWAGVQYQIDGPIDVRDLVFDVQLKVDELAGADVMRFNLILEEVDGDRWHVPYYSQQGYLPVRVEDQWQRFLLGFSDFAFWPLGKNTKEPDCITSIKVEATDAQDITFTAQVKINLVTTKQIEGLSP